MLLGQMAVKILGMTLDQAPPEAVETSKQAILDTLGVTLAGAGTEVTRTVHDTVRPLSAPGPALVFGQDQRIDLLNAALVNGTASHALDFDDCSNSMGGHPSAPVVPALWALAEDRGGSGRAFLAAYIAGVECETRLARAVNFHHYEKGWHPTSTLGTFGSTAACGHLIGLNADRMTHALALAASMAAGLKANFGTMAKPFHVGQAARNGLLAALLAENGMTANPAALEDAQGFFRVYNGDGKFDADRVLADWASPLDVIEPGIAFKRHPCCASTHPAVDALLRLKAEHDLTPDKVSLVESWTHPRRLRHTNRPDPKTGLDGKFSVQYVLARALAQGLVSLDHFSDEAVRDPAVRALMSRVRAAPDPDARMDTSEHFYARVRVTLGSGEQVEAFVDRPLGRDRHHPLPPGTLEAKFRDCATQVLTEAAAAELLDALLGLESCASISEVSGLIAAGLGSGRPAPALQRVAS